MKYYFYIVGNTIGSLRRTDFKPGSILLERWDEATKEWINSPETYGGVEGFASDADNYKEITKAEAEKYIKKRSRPKATP